MNQWSSQQTSNYHRDNVIVTSWENIVNLSDVVISAHNTSTINVSGDAQLRGGTFGRFKLYDSSTLNVYGGDVGIFVTACHSSVINLYDGALSWPNPVDNGTINVYGGYIREFMTNYIVPPETATINIYGYNFNYNPHAKWVCMDEWGCWWVSKLTATGFDGTDITYWGLPDPYTHDNINLIPEPSTLLLFGLGIPALLRKRRR